MNKAKPLPVLFLLSLLAILIYSNTFSASFHFDDGPNIAENLRIKNLSNFLDLSGTRYMGYLSFALNYLFGGLNVFGYHWVNLLIHITNGFLVYKLALLLFQSPRLSPPLRGEGTGEETWIALTTALLFVAHPVQTQAVTYIVQRFTSLAALFYLLTVVCYLKWRLAPSEDKGRYLWYAGTLLSTVLAMKTKENSFTLPFMIVAVEWTFFRSFTRKQWATLIPFLLTLSIIPLSRLDVLGEMETGLTHQTTEISRPDYLFTQFRVMMTYLRLLVLPIRQNLDYDYPIYHSLLEPAVFLSFLFLSSLLILSLFLLFNSKIKSALGGQNSKLISFGILWFFLTLSIESSIIPIRDVIFEHRLYLPSIGFFLSLTTAVSHLMSYIVSLKSRLIFGIASFSLILFIFSVTTYQRNFIWKNDVSLWEDVVRKAPKKPRAHYNLGRVYQERRGLEDVVREYQTALTLKPDYVEAHTNLGTAYYDLGRIEEAIQEYQSALKLKPDYAPAHNNLGIVYGHLGRLEEALQEYQSASALKPDSPEAHTNLGTAYYDLGRIEEALREYQTALKLKPNAVTHYNLGLAYKDLGRVDRAAQEYKMALTLDPNHVSAHHNLGNVYAAQGRLDEAVREYQTALRLDPNHAEAHYHLGWIYTRLGRLDDARRHYQEALQIQPDLEAARQALESLQR